MELDPASDGEGNDADAAFLRSSCEVSLMKEDMGAPDIDLRASASMLVTALRRAEDRDEAAAGAAPSSAKRRMCVVCGAQVAKELPQLNGRFYCVRHRCSVCDCPLNKEAVTVGNTTTCPQHSQSTSSRLVEGLSGANSNNVKPDNGGNGADVRFVATRQLLSLLKQQVDAGKLSGVDLLGVHAVVAMKGFSVAQQRELELLVAGGPVVAPNATAQSRRECAQLVEGMAGRCGLLDCQTAWLRVFLENSEDGFSAAGSAELEEVRLLSLVYADSFRLGEPNYEAKVRGSACTATVRVVADAVSLEVVITFFEASAGRRAACDFGSAAGLTTGDLAVLANMLALPGRTQLTALSAVQTCQQYVTEVAERATQTAAAVAEELAFPFVTRGALSVTPTVRSKSFEAVSLRDLDRVAMKSLHAALQREGGLFELLHVENVISESTLARFREKGEALFSSDDVSLQPMCAWHGTPSPDNVASIIENGILAPFDMTKRGEMIRIMHGSAFGQGIYLSDSLKHSSWYAPRNSARITQVFFSVVLLGKARVVTPSEEEFFGLWNKSLFESANECQSYLVPHCNTIVVFESCQVLPLFLVTCGPKGSANRFPGASRFSGLDAFGETRELPMDDFASKKENTLTSGNAWHRLRKWGSAEPLSVESLAWQEHGGLCAYRIPTPKGQHWLLVVPPVAIEDLQPAPVRVLFLLDRSKSMGSSFQRLVLPACKRLYRALNPSSAQVLLFGSSVELIGADKLREKGPAFFDSLQVTLEDETNLVGAMERATDIVLRDLEKIRGDKEPEPTFLIVLLSDGCDTRHTQSEATAKVDRLYKMVTGATARIVFRAINIGKHADTRLVMSCKAHLETVCSYEEAPLLYARARSEIPKLCGELASQLQGLLGATVRVRRDEAVPFEGLVRNMLEPAGTVAQMLASPGAYASLLLRGPVPHSVSIEDLSRRVVVVDNTTWLDSVVLQGQLLRVLRRHVDDVCVAAVAGQAGLAGAVEQIRALIGAVSDALVPDGSLASAEVRVRLMRERKQMLFEIREMLNRVQETILLKGATSDQQSRFLVRIESLQYGLRALRRALPVDMDTVSRQCRALAQAAVEVPAGSVDLVSARSGKTTVAHWRELAGIDLSAHSLMDLLYSFSFVGLAARVRRSEACVIDAWALHVDYVSNDALDSGTALCLTDASLFHRDATGENVRAVVPVGDPRNFAPYLAFSRTSLFRHYHSVVFASNPDLFNPRMGSALLAMALVRAVTQLLTPARQDAASLEAVLKLRYTLRARMLRGESDANVSYWSDLVTKLRAPDVAQHLTEAAEDDVGSVAKVLATMVCLSDRLFGILEDRRQMSVLFLALLAETASRGARIEVKQTGGDEHLLLLQALGITSVSCVVPRPVSEPEPKNISFGDDFNTAAGRKRSSRFFRRELALSNCPPTAVLACLTLCRVLAREAASFQDSVLERTVDWSAQIEMLRNAMAAATMKSALQELVIPDGQGPCDAALLQIGLYAQGLQHHTSQARRGGVQSLRDPEKVLRELARTTRREVYVRLLGVKLKELKALNLQHASFLRRELQKERQRNFAAAHKGLPKCLTSGEAADLGVEIGETGLPLHVCAHVQCPLFLKPLGPLPFSEAEAVALKWPRDIKVGTPLCKTKDCKRNGKAMNWGNAERAAFWELKDVKDDYFYVCLRCKVVLPRPPDPKPTSRRYLYNHLSPEFVPERVYVRGLHVAAKGVMASSKVVLTRQQFVKKLMPMLVGVSACDGEDWVQLVADPLYAVAVKMYSRTVGGADGDWTSTLSPAQLQELQADYERRLASGKLRPKVVRRK